MSQQISVLSSHYEGMPLALVEAMAAGCAVVGSAVPGIREMLTDGVDGRLFPHADAQALADILQELLAEPAIAAELARHGREHALEHYSMEQMLARYEHAFAEVSRPGSALRTAGV